MFKATSTFLPEHTLGDKFDDFFREENLLNDAEVIDDDEDEYVQHLSLLSEALF